MINIIIVLVFVIALVCSIVNGIKTKDEDAKMCWLLSGVFWFILAITHTVIAIYS